MRKLFALSLAVVAIVCIFVFGVDCPQYPFMKIVELGNNFALLQQDDTDIEYSPNGSENCYQGGVQVVPWEVVAYNFNDRWIIAKSDSKAGNNPQYWIIDKLYDFSPDYRKELEKQTIGPLDSIGFYKTLKEHNIALSLILVE